MERTIQACNRRARLWIWRYNMTIAMERILEWKIMPRLMMLVMTIMYVRVIEWFMTLPQDAVSTQATALTATVTGAMTGAFAVWLGSERK